MSPHVSPAPQSGGEPVKISVNVAQWQVDMLKDTAVGRDCTMTEVLRHGIALIKFIDEQEQQGGTFYRYYRDGTKQEMYLLNGIDPAARAAIAIGPRERRHRDDRIGLGFY